VFSTFSPEQLALVAALPPLDDTVAFIRSLNKRSVRDVLAANRSSSGLLLQPRSGVGEHCKMLDLLLHMDAPEAPHILSMTIDSHTRLERFDKATEVLAQAPDRLNGYPLVSHGWERGRELNLKTVKPIEVRHGSPDGRILFHYALAAGLTSFEGGGIGYNIPYCQGIPVLDTLRFWRDIDSLCGELATRGVVIDREYFGTLTAVLMPPSISIACALLEAVLAREAGVTCHTLAICQNGYPEQDIAALRVLRRLAAELLEGCSDLYVALHQFMGVFPRRRVDAEALILMGGFVAKAGGADKVVTKTYHEALGIPTTGSNLEGVNLTHVVNSRFIDRICFNVAAIEVEMELIEGEVRDLLGCALDRSDHISGIGAAFDQGLLDVPLSANNLIRSAVFPVRDRNGAVRYLDYGALHIGERWRKLNAELLNDDTLGQASRYTVLRDSVLHFSRSDVTNDQGTGASPGVQSGVSREFRV
jgi:methylaspartate mutase epsilon subunit